MDKPLKIFFTVLMTIFVVLGLVSMGLYVDLDNAMQLAMFAGVVLIIITLMIMALLLVWD